jgi:hexosaminidase
MRLLPFISSPTLHLGLVEILLVLQIFTTNNGVHALWPEPRSLQTGSTALRLSPSSFSINLDAIPNAPWDLLAAAHRTRTHLVNDKLARLDISRGAVDVPVVSRANYLSCLTLCLEGDAGTAAPVRSIAEEARAPLGMREEGYNLSVPADGSEAVLSAASTLGLFRGLNTFAQLWYYHHDGERGQQMVYTLTAPVMIEDWPAYVRLINVVSMGWLTRERGPVLTAVSRVHAGHRTKFVRFVLYPFHSFGPSQG